jgi:hypothetical protein
LRAHAGTSIWASTRSCSSTRRATGR